MGNESTKRDAQATQPMVELFRPSLKSRWIRFANGFGIPFALIVLITAITTPVWHARAWALMGTWLVVGAALGYAIYRRIKDDQRPVMLTVKGIESMNFCGKRKDYGWGDIANAWIVPIGNGNALHLELAPGVASTAGAWHSRRSQPFVPLATFTATDQDLIVDGVTRHLRQTHTEAIDTHIQPAEREPIAQVIARAPTPWATFALMMVNAALWLLMLSQGTDILSPSAQWLLRWGGNAASEFQNGQWWRVLTALFVHGGLAHLTLTLLGLWSVGRIAERVYGLQTYLMIYMGSALIASALSLHFSAQKVVFVGGASSAVFGLAGALLIAVHQNREILPRLLGKPELTGVGVFSLYAVVQGFRATGLDNAAHLGALLAGAAMAAILPERYDLRHYEATVGKRRAAGWAAAVALCAVIAVLAPPAHTDLLRRSTGPSAYDQAVKSYADASALMRSLQEQVQSGQLSAIEMDVKSRSVLAPAFRQAQSLYAQAWLPPADPRGVLIAEFQHLTDLTVELLAMESVVHTDSSTLEAIDPVRAAHLNADIRASKERIEEIEANLGVAAPIPNQ
jgi:rhomboid protease GluP